MQVHQNVCLSDVTVFLPKHHVTNIVADCHHYPVRWAQRKPPLLLKFGMQLCKPNQDFDFKRDFEFPADECITFYVMGLCFLVINFLYF